MRTLWKICKGAGRLLAGIVLGYLTIGFVLALIVLVAKGAPGFTLPYWFTLWMVSWPFMLLVMAK